MESKLKWYVLYHDGNSSEIESKNIFDLNWVFLNDLLVAKKKYGSDYKMFCWYVKKCLMYSYWSRCEYELVVSTWVGKEVEKKIDIYEQIMMNWEQFIKYVWENKKWITKKKLGLVR